VAIPGTGRNARTEERPETFSKKKRFSYPGSARLGPNALISNLTDMGRKSVFMNQGSRADSPFPDLAD